MDLVGTEHLVWHVDRTAKVEVPFLVRADQSTERCTLVRLSSAAASSGAAGSAP